MAFARVAFAWLPVFLPVVASSAEGRRASFAEKPSATAERGRTVIRFAVSASTDVEVSILDARGTVVRHLAAGVLGGEKPPPAPLKPGLAQEIEWDGRDDYGAEAKGGPFRAQVRIGMGIRLDAIAGGDPYAYYSKEMGQGDHAAWRITGLEAKPDGTVYVLGNANNYGPPALRAYAADGRYLRTVYPPPAGKPVEKMRGWGVTVRRDGTYAPLYNDLSSPALSKTIICGIRGRIARLLPSPEPDSLLIEEDYRLMRIGTDGTAPENPMLEGLLVSDPPIARKGAPPVVGPLQMALSADGRYFFLSGIFAASGDGKGRTGAEKTGFWRDGQVFKVDAASRRGSVFFALPEKDVIADLDLRGKSSIADFKYGTYAALQGVAADRDGRVFVCDRQNRRVLVLSGEGKIERELVVEYPDAVAVHPRSRILYVTVRTGHYHGRGELKLLRFADWSRDSNPQSHAVLCPVSAYDQATRLAVAEAGDRAYLWVCLLYT
ncbi:MAG: hypothetical protein N3A38_05120, partial [Planctomycetota bacterium]|nr:hypothetical protein [Planctomycetota bacterium]